MRIVCFGDSICQGYGVRPELAWVWQVQARFETERPGAVRVINAGVNGETSNDGLHRLQPMLKAGRPDVLYVQFGLNDCWMEGMSCELFMENMYEIVRRSLEQTSARVVLASNHPAFVDAGLQDYGGTAYQSRVAAYNAALRAEWSTPQERVVWVDMEQFFAAHASTSADFAQLVQDDGVHLSRAGNTLYGDILYPVLRGMMFNT